MNKVLFSDFDGVLFDTIKEAYIVCRHAFFGTDFLKNIDENEYKKFYRFKYLVYNSWQYYYLMKLLNLPDKELVEKYTDCMKNRDLPAESSFDTRFYQAREDLIKNHHDFWDKLETPFEFFDLVKDWVKNKKFDLIIVSKKNKSAIIYRLNQYGLTIPPEHIFGKDELKNYATKADFMHEYIDKFGIKEAVFVDDNSNNLVPCKKYPEITPLLAGWGNIKIGEVGLTPDDVIEKIV